MERRLENFNIRPAVADDVPIILSFIRSLADYERLSHELVATEVDLRRFLFGPRPMAEVILGYWSGEAVSLALFFHNFSTFLGRPGLYLEDLFVKPEMRGRGIGRAMLTYLAKETRKRGCGRLEWSVLTWNSRAIGFYKSLGAITMDEWVGNRLAGEALENLAAEFDPQSEKNF